MAVVEQPPSRDEFKSKFVVSEKKQMLIYIIFSYLESGESGRGRSRSPRRDRYDRGGGGRDRRDRDRDRDRREKRGRRSRSGSKDRSRRRERDRGERRHEEDTQVYEQPGDVGGDDNDNYN